MNWNLKELAKNCSPDWLDSAQAMSPEEHQREAMQDTVRVSRARLDAVRAAFHRAVQARKLGSEAFEQSTSPEEMFQVVALSREVNRLDGLLFAAVEELLK